MSNSHPDLTKRPPRSPRVRIGGYVLLARMLDKGRATLAGKNGEYHFDCPLDQHFLKFAGVKAKDIKKQLKKGLGDGDILKWIEKNSKNGHCPVIIEAWSTYQEKRAPSNVEMRTFFNKYHSQAAPKRDDVSTWFDLLDIDDHVTFGGKA